MAAAIERVATCRCGQLRAACLGEPVRVSVCHCVDCQKRSGSAFAYQARLPQADVRLTGDHREWAHIGESGVRTVFRFCPTCGSTVTYASDGMPGLAAVAVGGFADPTFPAPHYSVYASRRHRWVTVAGDAIDHYD